MSGGQVGDRSVSSPSVASGATSPWRGRIEGRAGAAAEMAADRVAARLGEALPGVSVAREPGRVVISGRGLSRRWFDLPVLRWIAGVVR